MFVCKTCISIKPGKSLSHVRRRNKSSVLRFEESITMETLDVAEHISEFQKLEIQVSRSDGKTDFLGAPASNLVWKIGVRPLLITTRVAGIWIASAVVRPVARIVVPVGLAYAGFYPAALVAWMLI